MTAADDADMKQEEVVVECELESSPEKLWRALTQEPFLADWLGARPAAEGAEGPSYRIVEAMPYSRVRYAWHDPDHPDAPPAVTVELERLAPGRTWFRLIHGETVARIGGAANSNPPQLALAA